MEIFLPVIQENVHMVKVWFIYNIFYNILIRIRKQYTLFKTFTVS